MTDTKYNKKKTWSELGLTSIAISRKNYEVLKRLGFVGDSFNDIMTRIFEAYPDMSRETLAARTTVKKNDL